MSGQLQLNSDRLLAFLAVAFVGVMLLLQLVFGALRGGNPTSYWITIWVATVLVVAMVIIALGRLQSSNTTLFGGTLAVLAILHAPLFLGMRFGLVDLPTMQTFDVVSRAILYPLLGIFGLLVFLRPFFRSLRLTSRKFRPV